MGGKFLVWVFELADGYGAEFKCALSEQRGERLSAQARAERTRPTRCGNCERVGEGGRFWRGIEWRSFRAEERALFKRRRAERRALPWAEGVGPVFGFLAEVAADGVHCDVMGFFLEFGGVAEAMVEEVALPLDFVLRGDVVFPVGNGFGEAGIGRKSEYSVEVVWHE